MAGFDAFPARVRDVLREAPVNVAAQGLVGLARKMGAAALARGLRGALMREFPAWTPPV